MRAAIARENITMISVVEGGSFTFVCKADGIPSPSIQWFYDDILIDISSAPEKVSVIQRVGAEIRPLVETSVVSELVLWNLVQGDTGNYSCTASNGLGQADSLAASYQLIVSPRFINYCFNASICANGGRCINGQSYFFCFCPEGVIGDLCQTVLDPSSILMPPTIAFVPITISVPLYNEVVLYCPATGNPQPVYEWLMDERVLDMENSPYLRIQQMQLKDIGLYYCVARNQLGQSISNSTFVTVDGTYYSEIFCCGSFKISLFPQELASMNMRSSYH